MAIKTLIEMPLIEIKESTYVLSDVRKRLSGAIEQNIDTDLANVCLCMANEIAKLQEEIKELKKES